MISKDDSSIVASFSWNLQADMSLHSTATLILGLLYCSDPPAPMILCANKVDMAQKRIVSSDAGREMARRLGVPYMETSAKDPPQNIDDVFREAVRLIRRGQGEGERGRGAKNKRCSIM